jgi:diguanylate cyclase (GGDEF)-like protein/PAS domain S-box-containing protein
VTQSRAFARAAVGCAALVVGFFLLLLLPQEQFEVNVAVQLTELLIAVAASVACAQAARVQQRRGLRNAWHCLSGAALSWGLGELAWAWYDLVLGVETPFPSWADLGFLGFYPLAVFGLVLLVRSPSSVTRRVRGPVEGLLVASAMFLIGWATVLQPIVRESTPDTFGHLLSLGYVLADIVALSLALFALTRTAPAHRGVVALLCAGIAGLAVSDTAFAYFTALGTYGDGHLLDVGWVAAFALLLLAAVRARTTPVDGSSGLPPSGGLLLPLLIVTPAVVACVVAEVRGKPLGAVGSLVAGTLVVLLLVQLWSVVRENQQLTGYLSDQVQERTAKLSEREQHFRALTEGASDVLTLVDRQGVISYQSPSGCRLHGRTAEQVTGTPYPALLVTEDAELVERALQRALAEPGSPVSVRSRACLPDGTLTYLDTTIVNLLAEPSVSALLLSSRDITERVVLERELEHQATHDALTGLPHRVALRQRGAAVLRDGYELGVLLLDLEGFGDVNDAYGRERGDALLRVVAGIIAAEVGPHDTAARLGGDEFAVLVPGMSAFESVVLAERLHRAVTSPIHLDGLEIALGAHLGVATTAASARDIEVLLKDADVALFVAKQQDGAPFLVHGPEVQAAQADRAQLRSDLLRAVDHEELFLQYQPVIDLETGRLKGVEALVRWRHPVRGVIPPLDFIPLAEDTGIILPLGRWVLETACRSAAVWQHRVLALDDSPFSISVNVAARQLRDHSFVDDVRRVLLGTGLPASALVLEITETALLKDMAGASMRLQQLKDLGVRIAIDDFGVGYSSLSYLHQLPLDILKVDRSFVSGVIEDGAKRVLTRAVLDLAKSLGLWTIAEGVETDEQREMLRDMGCREAQGFLFARPMDGDRLDALLQQGVQQH